MHFVLAGGVDLERYCPTCQEDRLPPQELYLVQVSAHNRDHLLILHISLDATLKYLVICPLSRPHHFVNGTCSTISVALCISANP